MGLVTLDGFRVRMQAALGNFNYSSQLLDVWINAGVQEVAGAVDFDILRARVDVTFTQGTYRYTVPPDLLKPISIGWPVEDRWLLKSSNQRLDTMNRDRESWPQFWSLESNGSTLDLLVWPTPHIASVASMLYIMSHPELNDTADVTLFPATWDNAVHYFGVAAAMLDLGDDERSLFWHDKATKYAGSRITDAEYGSEAISEPVRVVRDGASLYRQRTR